MFGSVKIFCVFLLGGIVEGKVGSKGMVERKWTKKGWTDGSGSGMVLFNKLMKRLNI